MYTEEVRIELEKGKITLQGDLSIPSDAKGLVMFAHGSGSSRMSPRNRFVASVLNRAGLATLLFDLLTREEEVIDIRTREYRFNIDLLAQRLQAATDWVDEHPKIKKYNIGYFGSSTGAAAALIAAARSPFRIGAIVSRGGRPDMAASLLPDVNAPTLLIVGSNDEVVIDLNQQALSMLKCQSEIMIIQGATHLFEEPGTLEQVAQGAANWFLRFLP